MWHSAPLKTWARGLLAGSLPGIRGLMMVFAVVMDCCHLRLCIIYLSHTYVLIHPICKHRTDVTLSNIQVCHPCTNLRSRDIPGDLAWEEFPSSSDGASPQHRDTGTSPHAFCASVFQPVIGGELLPLSRGNRVRLSAENGLGRGQGATQMQGITRCFTKEHYSFAKTCARRPPFLPVKVLL